MSAVRRVEDVAASAVDLKEMTRLARWQAPADQLDSIQSILFAHGYQRKGTVAVGCWCITYGVILWIQACRFNAATSLLLLPAFLLFSPEVLIAWRGRLRVLFTFTSAEGDCGRGLCFTYGAILWIQACMFNSATSLFCFCNYLLSLLFV